MMNDYITYELEELQEMEETKESFKIDNIDLANWALRKINALNKRILQNEELAKSERLRIDTWLNKATEADQNSINHFNFLLEQYYREEKELDNNFKLSTPYGSVSMRSQPIKWEIDEELLIKTLKTLGENDLIRIKQEINKTELKKAFKVVGDVVCTEDGEIVEGVKIVPQEPKIVIKIVE